MSNATVTVVIPVYNGSPFIGAAIDSCLAQSTPILECIVVDDGSDDDTAAVVEAFGSPVQLYRRKRQGVAAARNYGIEVSTGTHVAFLDADDVWMPHKLQRQIEVAQSGDGAAICGFLTTNRDLEVIGEQRGSIDEGLRSLMTFNYGGISGSSLLVSRERLERIGRFDPLLSTSADWELLARLLLDGPVAVIAEPLLFYRIHQSNMRRNVAAMEHDSLLAFDKIFRDERIDPALKADEAYCRAVLHKVLAGSYYDTGHKGTAVRHLAQAAWLSPAYVVNVMSRRAFGGRRQLSVDPT